VIFRTIREWDYLEIGPADDGKSVTRAQADRLVEAASAVRIGGREGVRILDNNVRRLRAQQIVGVIVADGGVTLEILPKIDGHDGSSEAEATATRRNLVHMLARVIDLDIAEGRITDLDWQRDNLLEILIALFCDRLFEAIHRGVPRRYVGHDEDRAALRGRLDAKRQFTMLAASPQLMACRYEELSADIALNRIMKAAVMRLRNHARAERNQRRLAELSFAFAEVTTVPVRELPWDEVVIDRTNRAWSQLIELAKLLLGERFQTTSSGGVRGFSLLFEMNTLFEEFVGRTLQRRMVGRPYRICLQGPQKFGLVDAETGKARFAMRPDIVLYRGAEPALIIDTKWKRLKRQGDDPRHGVAQADIYQMMAYAQVYGCARMLLLYPHYAGLGRDAGMVSEHRINGTDDVRIAVATLSLADPTQVAERLAGLVECAIGETSAGDVRVAAGPEEMGQIVNHIGKKILTSSRSYGTI
jgi:5-methylcytosine-specific restriction enzyme subunit McrC